jgi:hypothetical protein
VSMGGGVADGGSTTSSRDAGTAAPDAAVSARDAGVTAHDAAMPEVVAPDAGPI